MTTPVVGRRRWARLVAVPTAAVFLIVLFGGVAFAHAALVGTDPADGAVLDRAPAAVTVTFNEPIGLADGGNQLLNAAGSPIAVDVVARDNTVVFTPAATLSDGTYIVSWRVISADTHPVAGGISFSVGEPSSDVVAVAGGDGSRQVNVLRVFFDVLRYAGVLGFVGLLWFGVFIAGDGPRRSQRFADGMRRTTRGFAAVAGVSAVVLIPLARVWQNGEDVAAVFSPRVWSEAVTGATAIAAVVMLAGMGLALYADRRRWPQWSAVGLALALGSLIIEGHTRTYGPSWLVIPADLLHVTMGALWFGGLIGLVMLLVSKQARARNAAAAVGRFSTVALLLVIALGAAAVLLWWRVADSVSGLWTSLYGQLVLVKLGLVAVVVALAAWNRYRLVPAINTNGRTAPPRIRTSRQRGPVRPVTPLTRLRRNVAAEALILIVVIGVTGVLVTQQPPERETAAATSPQQTLTATADGITATIVLLPGAKGTNSMQVSFTDRTGTELELYEAPTVSVKLAEHDIGPFQHPLSAVGDKSYQAIVDFPLPGTWQISIPARVSEFSAPILTTEVSIE